MMFMPSCRGVRRKPRVAAASRLAALLGGRRGNDPGREGGDWKGRNRA